MFHYLSVFRCRSQNILKSLTFKNQLRIPFRSFNKDNTVELCSQVRIITLVDIMLPPSISRSDITSSDFTVNPITCLPVHFNEAFISFW